MLVFNHLSSTKLLFVQLRVTNYGAFGASKLIKQYLGSLEGLAVSALRKTVSVCTVMENRGLKPDLWHAVLAK